MSYGAPPPPPPSYGAGPTPPYGGPAPDHKQSTLILVFGILSIVCCGFLLGVPAIIMGKKAMDEIDASGGTIGGRGKVKAGFICGIIGTALSVIGIIIRLAGVGN